MVSANQRQGCQRTLLPRRLYSPKMATCEGARQFYNIYTIGRYVDIFKLLLAHGANIHAYTYDEGWTAHMSAKGVREIHELFRSDESYDKYFKQVYLSEDCGLHLVGGGRGITDR